MRVFRRFCSESDNSLLWFSSWVRQSISVDLSYTEMCSHQGSLWVSTWSCYCRVQINIFMNVRCIKTTTKSYCYYSLNNYVRGKKGGRKRKEKKGVNVSTGKQCSNHSPTSHIWRATGNIWRCILFLCLFTSSCTISIHKYCSVQWYNSSNVDNS